MAVLTNNTLNTLPPEIVVKIASLLLTPSLINLFMACKNTHTAIKGDSELTFSALKSKGLTSRVEDENKTEFIFTVINITADLSSKASQFIEQVQKLAKIGTSLGAQFLARGQYDDAIFSFFPQRPRVWSLKCSLVIAPKGTRIFERQLQMNIDCRQIISMKTPAWTIEEENAPKGLLKVEAYGDERITKLANILFHTLKQFIEPAKE